MLDDSHCRQNLYPFTRTRHTADIRIGILSIREKWEHLTGENIYTLNANKADNINIIKANTIPTLSNFNILSAYENLPKVEDSNIKIINYPWQIFQLNDWALRQDFELITKNRKSQPLSDTNKVIMPEMVFIEPGAVVEHSILNASAGPIYIGKNAVVMEGNLIRGPFALCEGAVLKMGSRIYGASTIGPYSVAGGEIKNSVIFGYSNKAHDGYLGDSVIGEWCNLGAGTSNSNVKNNAGDVKYRQETNGNFMSAGNKAGLLMGDYSRAAINSSFNTGTVVGVCCNIFGSEMPAKYIPDFSWGNERYDFDKALADITNWKKMKGAELSDKEINILKELYLANQ